MRARPQWQRYAWALIVTLFAISARLALDPVLGRFHDRHLVFLPTVMIAAWLGGLRPGIMATVLSTLAIDYFWTGAGHGLMHPDASASDFFELGIYFAASVVICVLMASLETARARADAETKSREHVLAIVAHDLRNPLTTITMATALLRNTTDDEELKHRHLATVDRAASRMERLIRDLVDATRIESGELVLALGDHEVVPIVDEIVEECRPLAQKKGIVVEREVAEGTITCDRARILQTLANLVSNALNFTPDGGRVTVRALDAGDSVRFEVADTGPGIRPEHLPHIFERNWTGGSNGLGLGLFIADNIVRAHGARLSVTSEPGRGARFTFTIRRRARRSAADGLR